MTASAPKRRLLRLSLRTRLVFVVVLAVVLGWLVLQVERARRQAELSAPFRELGGKVDFHVPLHTLMFSPQPGNIRGIGFSGTALTDADLKRLKLEFEKHTELRRLILSTTEVTDAGLEHLANLTTLQFLYLEDTRVTDTGLEYLTGLTSLKSLWVCHTQVTAEGEEKLQQALPKCRIQRHYP